MAPQSTFNAIVGTSVAFSLIACASVGLRLYARVRIIKLARHDDAVLILALMGMLAYTVFVCAQLPYGLGVPIQEVPLEDLSKVLMYLWASILCYAVSLSAIKTSILLQFLRFLVGKKVTRLCWVMVGVCICYGISSVFATIFFCVPVSGFWKPSPTDRCISRQGLWLAHSGINIVTDVIIFLIPVPTVLQLNMNMRQKIAVIGVFCIGIIVCLITVLRLDSIITVARTSDVTYDNVKVAIWSNAELTTAIFCACLSGIKPFVQWVSTRKSLSRSRQSYILKIPGDIFNSGNNRNTDKNLRSTRQELGSGQSSSRLRKDTAEDAAVSQLELSSSSV
ncbi:hypothetical protein N8I77_011306 [Diaporthe amygdali]|uniref:Rhodopsin domain-containing protein n=1 Tax=Phomopsis amygdali TaxID=1214568 RepID=A0AAD9S5C4_PHOAM|nr:hypothetical protein N8I77_011306 [Diaporthe amygdali]